MLDPRPSRRPLLAAPLVAFALAASAAAQVHVISDDDATASFSAPPMTLNGTTTNKPPR